MSSPPPEPESTTDSVETFFAAVEDGDTSVVRSLLDDDPTLLASVSVEGVRAPLAALYAGHAALADELAGRSGPLDIHEASAFDDNGRLRAILREDPAAVATWSLDGWQPLHLAAYFGRTESARHLLDEEAPPDEPSRNAMAVHPLHAAAAGSHSEIVWLLIASGVDVDATQRHGWTALHSAAANGDVDSIQALLSAGARSDLANDEGQTARDVAADQVRALLS